MSMSFGQNISHSTGDYKNSKTRGQCKYLTEKLNFHFLKSLFFGVAREKGKKNQIGMSSHSRCGH